MEQLQTVEIGGLFSYKKLISKLPCYRSYRGGLTTAIKLICQIYLLITSLNLVFLLIFHPLIIFVLFWQKTSRLSLWWPKWRTAKFSSDRFLRAGFWSDSPLQHQNLLPCTYHKVGIVIFGENINLTKSISSIIYN